MNKVRKPLAKDWIKGKGEKSPADKARTGMKTHYNKIKGKNTTPTRKRGGVKDTPAQKNQYKVQPTTTGTKTATDGPKRTMTAKKFKKKEGGRTYGNTKN